MGTIDALTSVSQNLQNNDQLSSLFSSRCPLVIQTTKVHESKGRRNIIKSDYRSDLVMLHHVVTDEVNRSNSREAVIFSA